MELDHSQEIQLPVNQWQVTLDVLQEKVARPFKEIAEQALLFQEKLAYGRVLTHQERMLEQKRKKEKWEKQRQQYEIEHYGRILAPDERRKAIRQEEIDKAEDAAHQAKLKALNAERKAAEEMAKGAIEQARIQQEKNQLLLAETIQVSVEVEQQNYMDLAPGENRTLEALKRAYPKGLRVKELATCTKKDAMAEETPRGSLDVWLKILEKKGLVCAGGKRPKRWFFVKKDES